MKKNTFPTREVLILAIGEIIVSLLTVGGYLLVSALTESVEFSYRVITGAALGSLVTILNFLFLSISVNRCVDNFLEIRGTKEMDEEEAEAFAAEHSAKIQNAVKTSFIVRTISILATLVVAFIVDWFAPLATVIPLIAYRPILSLGELVRRKFDKTPAAPEGGVFDNAESADDTKTENVEELEKQISELERQLSELREKNAEKESDS